MISKQNKDPIDALDARLKDARRLHQDPTRNVSEKEDKKGGALSLAFRVGVELVSAVAVGFGIGWLIDDQFDTKPWFMLVFLLLGGAAGILNVFRMARGFGYAVGYDETKNGQTIKKDINKDTNTDNK